MKQTAAEKAFRSLTVSRGYRSGRNDVVAEFYTPILSAATSYSRAVGYFTSTSLALYARGIDDFARRGGKMRLIASPHLNEDDIADIDRGYEVREVAERAVLRELDADLPEQVLNGLGVIGRLIAAGSLDIKLAFVERDGLVGIYHEKIGVFRDDYGDLIAFTGSANETMGGLTANFESVQAYRTWVPGDVDRALEIEEDFKELWANTTPSLTVIPFPEVARDRLVAIASSRPNGTLPGLDTVLEPEVPVVVETAGGLSPPVGIMPRDYQRQAVEAWLKQRGRGMLKMATGTGKTKTALFAAYQLGHVLRQREQPLVIVIVVPYQHLVDQWIPDVEAFGVRPVAVYESSQRWQPAVEDQLAEVRLGRRPVVAMVATNASFAGDRFQNILNRINQPLLIIADEAHNLGSMQYRDALPPNAQYRLALSATPERWLDDGTQALTGYFGPVAFELDLRQAIEIGALCRYRYHPRLVELTGEENELYLSLTAQIARLIAAGDTIDDDSNSPLGKLLRRRTGVLGHADGKLGQLAADMTEYRDSWFQLVYCAEGRKPTDDLAFRPPTQVAQVIDLLGNKLHVTAHPYVSDTPRAERKVLLRRFGTGDDLRALVAMKCLDEGVDIPDARVAYLLASSSNPRQFIQRRGRILRRAVGKSWAEIIDYVAVPKAGSPLNFDVERRLLIRELERVNEFAKLAENYEETLLVLRPLKETYQLMDM